MTTPCSHDECGCEVAGCCFDCPLPVCKYEEKAGMKTVLAKQRYLAIVHLLDEGRSVEWIVQIMGISRRTVFRAQAEKISATAPLTDSVRHAKMSIAVQ